MEFVIVLLVILVLSVILYQLFIKENTPRTIVKSKKDGSFYIVQDLPDKQEASDILAEIKERLRNIVYRLYETDKEDENIQLLYKRFIERPTLLTEGVIDERYTTYTLNKGQKMVFCLRTRNQEKRLYDINTLMYVSLHELAHIGSITYHHTPEFHKVFEMLLNTAVNMNYYVYEDYSQTPKEYCGLTISSNALKK